MQAITLIVAHCSEANSKLPAAGASAQQAPKAKEQVKAACPRLTLRGAPPAPKPSQQEDRQLPRALAPVDEPAPWAIPASAIGVPGSSCGAGTRFTQPWHLNALLCSNAYLMRSKCARAISNFANALVGFPVMRADVEEGSQGAVEWETVDSDQPASALEPLAVDATGTVGAGPARDAAEDAHGVCGGAEGCSSSVEGKEAAHNSFTIFQHPHMAP